MKEACWTIAFLIGLGLHSLVEDYRAERCSDHGDRWVARKGCSDPYCERRTK
jgi:hypothetical protein